MVEQSFDPGMYTKMLNLTSTYHRDVHLAISPSNPLNSASGKIVLITGASRGLGRGLAPSWAEAGAAGIVVTSRKEEALKEVTEAIEEKSGGKTEVLAVACEITSDESVNALFEKIKERFGRLDVVVANAGVMSK